MSSHIFPLFVQELVRIAFAECVASLAETAKRFLDVAYASKQQQQQQQQAVRDHVALHPLHAFSSPGAP